MKIDKNVYNNFHLLIFLLYLMWLYTHMCIQRHVYVRLTSLFILVANDDTFVKSFTCIHIQYVGA